ncbi:hypothetical protein BGZ83_000162 [Gryganskiella cystojenkinii]|nr:hypothetical protein BGZ83_000162 [Gryganskiella cystojenkinii]
MNPQVPQSSSVVLRVFEIPELADSIALYLRPVHVNILRCVSASLYAAYKPHLRLQFDRSSTSSWTLFPPLCKIEEPKHETLPENDQERDKNRDSCSTNNTANKTEPWMLIAQPQTSIMPGPHADQIIRGHLVRTITADTIDNFDQLVPLLKHCPNLHTLSVSRWKQDHDAFQELHSYVPKLEYLKVAFYLSADLNSFLLAVSGSTTAAALSSKTTWMTDNSSRSTDLKKDLTSRSREPGLRSLKTFELEHRVPDTSIVRWDSLKSALDRMPSLQTLCLTGIGFRRSRDEQGNLIIEDEAGETLLDNGHQRLEREWLDTHRTYSQMRSLSLLKGQCSKMNLLDLDRIFPFLTSLEVVHSELNWIKALEPADEDILPLTTVPTLPTPTPLFIPSLFSSGPSPSVPSTFTSTSMNGQILDSTTNNGISKVVGLPNRRVPYPELEHIKIMALEESGSRELIPQLVKARPGLASLETHHISVSLDELMVMGSLCSREGRYLKRCGIQPFWADPDWTSLMEKWYEMPFLSKLRHIYIQQAMNNELMLGKTLKSLHIGFACQLDSAFEPESIRHWNNVLRSLPNLQILRLDRYLRNFSLFEGLGRTPQPKLTDGTSAKASGAGNTPVIEEDGELDEDSLERPFLTELLVTFRFLPPEPLLPPTPPASNSESSLFSLDRSPVLQTPLLPTSHSQQRCHGVETTDLDRELIGRFRFLETLQIQYARRPENFEAWKRTWRPGLKVLYKERQSGSFH